MGKVITFRIFPGAEHEIAQQKFGDVDQHQADEDFVGTEPIPQERNNTGPEHAAKNAAKEDGNNNPAAHPGKVIPRLQGNPPAAERTQDKLSLGSDIPDVGPIADRESERDQQERRGFDGELAQCGQVLDRLDEEELQSTQRILTKNQKKEVSDSDGQAKGQHRRQDRHGLRGLGANFKPQHDRPPPKDLTSIGQSVRPIAQRSALVGRVGPAP